MKTNIAEIQCNNVNLTDPKVIHQLEKSSEKRVKKYMREALHTAQKNIKLIFLDLVNIFIVLIQNIGIK